MEYTKQRDSDCLTLGGLMLTLEKIEQTSFYVTCMLTICYLHPSVV